MARKLSTSPAPPARRRPTLTPPRLTPAQKAAAKQRMLKQLQCTDAPEQALRYHGFSMIAGIDEVGRGALFGPVTAAAVILPVECAALMHAGLRDSKQLTREEREALDLRIRHCAVAVSIADIDAATIDRINIYQATRLAMLTAVLYLPVTPDHLIIDAMRLDHPCAQTKLFYGDALCLSIAAASVVAKVHRDNLLRAFDLDHPQYGFASHKGYATPEHRRALRSFGPTPQHRRSFAPVLAADPEAALDAAVADMMLFDEEAVLLELLDGDPSPETSEETA